MNQPDLYVAMLGVENRLSNKLRQRVKWAGDSRPYTSRRCRSGFRAILQTEARLWRKVPLESC